MEFIMEQEWKESLYRYVEQLNRGRVEPLAELRHSAVNDPRFWMEQGERSRRLGEWYHARGIKPQRGETGVKVLRVVRQTPSEVIAEISLHSTLFYEKGGVTHREDVVNSERLTFVHDGGGWEIAAVERAIPERQAARSRAADHFKQSVDWENEPMPLPQPLLNRSLLGGISGNREVLYDRAAAARYADRWWQEGNPEFETFAVDCTNYVSQCLFAGGAPINYTGKRETGWWYKGYNGKQEWWSFSWSVSDSLQRYLSTGRNSGLRAEIVARPEQLMLGDVIQYDWDGNGQYQHSTIVTALDAGGMPLVNAHTVSSRHRYWDYRDSYAWNERTVYRFFHIHDYL